MRWTHSKEVLGRLEACPHDMPHPLQNRVEVVRRKAIGLVRLHGLCLLALAIVAVAVVFGGLDFLLRMQDRGARSILTGGAVVALVYFVWRLAGPALRYRLGLVQVAQRIESFYPKLGERLSSAIDFLAQDEADQRAGSAGLRRAVVAEAEALSSNLDFRLAIDGRRTRLAWLLAGSAALLATALAFVDGGRSAGLALSRLAMPWRSDLAWPRRNTLELVKRPEKVATGDDFEVELVDRSGRLPDAVRMQLRYATPTGTRTETKEMKPLTDRMIFRLDNVTQGFDYRASGGDDDTMPWTTLAVIEPPKVVALDITVTPPAYTGLTTHSASRVVKAVAGSTLTIRGRVDKPIVSARLRSETQGVPLPAVRISASGVAFLVPADPKQLWLVEKSAAYWVELADESGLPTGRDTRLEVQVVPDSPPAIAWESPADHTFVTPRAVIPVKVLIKDDLAVQRVQLRYLRPGMSDQGEEIVDLYVGPPQAKPGGGMEDGDSRSLDTGWDLGRLAGLVPGDVLAARITAEDYKPQLTTSVVRRLTIITEEELESRIGQRQTSILGQIAEALRIQRQCREQVGALLIRLEEKRQLDPSDLNQLQSAQLNQRQVAKLLGEDAEGALGQIVALLAELAANRIEGRAVAERMNDLQEKIQQLCRGPLVQIAGQLTEAFKTAREATDRAQPSNIAPGLQAASARQDEVILALEALLGALTEWDSFSRLGREIGQIRSEQQHVAEATETLRLAAAATDSLPADERATARQLRQSELELARRLDKIQVRMEQMLARLQGSDPLAAGTLADSLDAGRRLAIGGRMRDAAEKLGQLQFGQSHRAQEGVLAGLQELLDLLSSRREDELARTIKSLRAAAGDLAGLARRQAAMQEELDAAAGEANSTEQKRRLQRLTRELAQLAQDAQRQSRRLQRLRAPQAAAAVGEAGDRSSAAGQSAGQGNAADAQEQSRQAQRRLEEAQQRVQEAIAQAEQELAEQQLARMEQWIGGLLARQKNVAIEIARLDEAKKANGGALAAAGGDALRNLAAEQRLIADETEQLRLKMMEQSAFAFALEGARQEMLRGANLLSRGQTDEPARQAAEAAATRLAQMLAALESDSGAPPTAPPPDTPPQPTPPGGQKDPFSSLAALKLLQLLQGEINRRTQALELLRATNGKLTDQQVQELDGLAAQQGRLADMVLSLIREAAVRPEDNPEQLPADDRKGDAKPKPSLDEQLLKELER